MSLGSPIFCVVSLFVPYPSVRLSVRLWLLMTENISIASMDKWMNERMHRIHSLAICSGGGGVYIRMYVCNLNPKQKQQTFDLFYWPDNWNKNKNSATKRRRQARERNQKSIRRKINLLKIKANKKNHEKPTKTMCHHNFDFIRAHTIRTYIYTYIHINNVLPLCKM